MWEVEKFRPFIPQIQDCFRVEYERYSVYSAKAQMKMNDFSAMSYVSEPIAQSEKQEVILSAEHISFQYEKIVRSFYEI